jgi:hypothetical protein
MTSQAMSIRFSQARKCDSGRLAQVRTPRTVAARCIGIPSQSQHLNSRQQCGALRSRARRAIGEPTTAATTRKARARGDKEWKAGVAGLGTWAARRGISRSNDRDRRVAQPARQPGDTAASPTHGRVRSDSRMGLPVVRAPATGGDAGTRIGGRHRSEQRVIGGGEPGSAGVPDSDAQRGTVLPDGCE